jgi:Asp-tRNA(Asn)/Glu-tRNA(Gln) amidotransferase A subunit family amidase
MLVRASKFSPSHHKLNVSLPKAENVVKPPSMPTKTKARDTAQAELVRRGEVQPSELVEAAIRRVERLNPQLNAVITAVFDKAHAQAVSSHLPDGPFRGVPLLLKDFLCETVGDPYYEGMRFLLDLGGWSGKDSYLAREFRVAGFRCCSCQQVGYNLHEKAVSRK